MTNIRSSIKDNNIPLQTLATLASGNSIVVYAADVHRLANGLPGVSELKAVRILSWLERIETMLSATDVPPDLRDPNVTRTAVERFEAQKMRLSASTYFGDLFAATVGASQ